MKALYFDLKPFLVAVSGLLLSIFFGTFESADQPVVYSVISYALVFWVIFSYISAVASRSFDFLLSSFYQIYSFSGLLVSAIFVSFGAPMFEIESIGYPNSVVWVLLVFFIFGLESSRYSYIVGMRRKENWSGFKLRLKHESWILYGVVIFSLLLIFAIFLLYSGPVFVGVDRVTFWRDVVPPSFAIVGSIFSQSFFFCAYLLVRNRVRGFDFKLPIVFFILYVFFSVTVLGEKFSVFVIYLSMLAIIAAGFGLVVRFSLKNVLYVAFVLFFLIGLVGLAYVWEGKEAIFLFARVALQSQLIWSVLNEVDGILLGGLNWGCFFGCDFYDSGEDLISARYLPDFLFAYYKQSGAGLTGFMPSLPILLWGLPAAFIIHCFISFVFGYFQSGLVKSIRANDFLGAILLWKFYFALVILWFAAKLLVIPGLILSGLVLFIYKFVTSRMLRVV